MKKQSTIKRICIVSGGYPTDDNPEYAFIEPLVHSLTDMSMNVDVIAPQSLSNALIRKKPLRPSCWMDYTEEGNRINIYQPKTITISKKGRKFNNFFTAFSIKRIIKKYNLYPDIVYAHFWHDAVLATSVYKDVPVIVATGEDNIWVKEIWDKKDIDEALKQIKGIIAVSLHCKNDSIKKGLCRDNIPIVVLPNGYSPKCFHPMDKQKAREELGIKKEEFVGIFVGEFCERKGPERVLDAIEKTPDLKIIFIGKGNLRDSDQILFKGRVSHNELIRYLNAADYFVLPTKSEGCSNAIVEAMACGLPIISSNGDFNDDILNDENSIRINPDSIEEIRDAIMMLKDNEEKRKTMSLASLKRASELTIEKRAERIVDFIDDCVGKNTNGY